ncbi:head-tail connector protein [Lysinibacillus boronitolerans]|nr:head-tail connector protein [Lysinibacillus boronitolerans]
MLNKIKQSLRITHNSLDNEIQDLIDAARADLRISGVVKLDETDSLIIRAITVYSKANFGLDNADSEKYQQSYDSLKTHLALSGEYNGSNV